MTICAYIWKTLILAFFAINAWNRFSAAPQETEAFKKHLKAFDSSIKSRVYPGYDSQISNFAVPHAHSIVYYGSIAQLVFSVLGVFCSCSSAVAGLLFFLFQMVSLNFAQVSLTDLKDLEKYALAVSLFLVSLALSCCCSKGCAKSGSCPVRSSEASRSHEQSNAKRRH